MSSKEFLSRTGEKYDCDICGWTYYKKDLKRQRGLLVCKTDFDKAKESGKQ